MMDADFPEGMIKCIDDLLANDNSEPGLDVYPGVFNSSLFFPLQRMREMEQMIRLARSISPRVVYEIGADKGGGLYHWCKCLPTVKRVIACEIRGTPYSRLFERSFPDIDFLWLPVSSHDPSTVSKVYNWLGPDKIDVLFMDGEKAKFREDYEAYANMVSGSGLILMHDSCDTAIANVFDQVAKTRRTSRIIDRSEGDEARERERRKERASCPYESWLREWGGESCTVGVVYPE